MTTAAQNTARQNAANAMRQAWATAKAAAAETGKKAALFFREALRQAWAAIKNAKEVITMPVIKDADYINNLLQGAFVDAKASDWTGRNGATRTYININGDRGFRGDRSAKIYVEDSKLVVDMGKGVHSQKFEQALKKIKELFA